MPFTTSASIPASIRAFYSLEIIRNAQPYKRFAQFAKRRTELQTNPGGSIKFTKYSNVSRGGKLTEGVNMHEKSMTSSEVVISVTEYGNAIAVSEKALQQSLHDELGEASIALANDMALVLDEEIRDVALSTTNVIYANGAANAGALTEDVDVFNTKTIKDAVEALNVNNAPKIAGQYYICIAHPHQLRQIRDDSNWINAHQYVNVDNIYEGEVGMYEGVRFVETTQMVENSAAVSTTKYGNAIKTWEAVIFGENSFAWAEALPVEMRDNGVTDYGRVHGIAWYAIWGFGLIDENYIFKILSA
jgi:N4-gp56 family major capsid protein